WVDVLQTEELQLHLFVEREASSSSSSSSSSNSSNSSSNSSNEQKGPLRWRASLNVLGEEEVQLTLGNFAAFYAFCLHNKLLHIQDLKLLKAYRPPVNPKPSALNPKP